MMQTDFSQIARGFVHVGIGRLDKVGNCGEQMFVDCIHHVHLWRKQFIDFLSDKKIVLIIKFVYVFNDDLCIYIF